MNTSMYFDSFPLVMNMIRYYKIYRELHRHHCAFWSHATGYISCITPWPHHKTSLIQCSTWQLIKRVSNFLLEVRYFTPNSSINTNCHRVRCVACAVHPYSRSSYKGATLCRHMSAGSFCLSIPAILVSRTRGIGMRPIKTKYVI